MKDYQIWEAIGDIDDKLVLEVNDANIIKRENARKRRRIIARVGLSTAACFAICFAMLWAVRFNFSSPKEIMAPNGENLLAVVDPTFAVDEQVDVLPTHNAFEAPIKTGGEIVLPEVHYDKTDRGDDMYVSHMFKWRKVNSDSWEEEFGDNVIKKSQVEHYFFVLTKKGDLLNGVLVLSQGNENFVEITAQREPVTVPEEYEFYERISDDNLTIKIYQKKYFEEDDSAQYYAVLTNENLVYTFEGVRQNIQEFKSALSQIIRK